MKYRIFVYLIFVFLLTSCLNFGATQLPPDRVSYNNSLQYSDTQQMVLNIVRLRYNDAPYFLSVNNVVSQFSFTNSLDINLSNNSVPPPALLATGTGSTSLSESPTITYTPLQGEEYVTKLLTPVDLGVVYMLLRAGWGVNEITRIFVQHLGHMDNATLASRTTSSRLPKYKDFHQFGLTILALQHDDNLIVTNDKISGDFAIRLTVKDFKRLTPKQRVILAKHHFTPATPSVWIVSWPTQEKQELFAQTRTVLGVFNYLSKGVDIPEEHILNHTVPMTIMKNGEYFDWRKLTIGQMRIRHSKTRPSNGQINIRYRGYWFYVADDDFQSKETLNILSIIMGIYQGQIKSVLPVFTVS